jgi:hypothetical protein
MKLHIGMKKDVGGNSNAEVSFVQAVWPGAKNDLSCFWMTQLYNLLRNKCLPNYVHILTDEAY